MFCKRLIKKCCREMVKWLINRDNLHYLIRLVFAIFAISYFSIELTNVWQPFFYNFILPYLNINDFWGIALMILCSVTTLVWLIFFFYHKTRINWRRIFPWYFIVFFLYVRFRYFSNSYNYLPIKWSFKYLDWGLILIGVSFISFIVIEILSIQSKKDKKDSSYLDDNAIINKEQDILDFSSKAVSVAQEIQKFDTSEHSISIGITGKWGAGKTSYINLILQSLPTTDYEIIRFFPRSSKDITTIQEDALNLLSERLKIYHLGLSSFFKDYIYALRLVNPNGWIDYMFSSYKNFNVQNKKDLLFEALKHLPKRVIFVIDDFDRLTQNEIIEVLKLLDNNANFPNVIYITAYDKQYVKQQFEDYNNHQGDSCFVDKFFNVELNIPLRHYYTIYNYIISQLRMIVDTAQFGYDISEINTIRYYSDILQKHIPTMRDAKRLINLFQSDYNVVRGEVDVIDFLLLSVVKYRYKEEYAALFRWKYITSSSNKTIEFIKDKTGKIACKDIIEHLFAAGGARRRPRRIYHRESFYNYFVDHINNTLRLPQLAELFTMDNSMVEPTIKGWSMDTTAMHELLDYIDSRSQQIESAEELFRYIDIVLMCNSYSNSNVSAIYADLIFRTTGLISDYRDKFSNKFDKDILYNHLVKYFDKDVLLEGDISLLRNMYLATDDHQNNLLLFQKDTINKIVVRHFNEYADKTNTFDKYGMNLLYACINNVSPLNSLITLERDCCDKARMLIKKYPEYYFNNFVRLLYISNNSESNAITCEPFWKQIFKSSENIHKIIFSERTDNIKNIIRVRNFWKIFTENNFNPIEFTHHGNVQNIINTDLEIQVGQLDMLKKHEANLKRLIIHQNNTTNFQAYSNNKVKIEEIKQNVEKIDLNIFFKSELIREINQLSYIG